MNKNPTLDELWTHLSNQGNIADDAPLPTRSDEEKPMPWYVAGLVGIGAWIAAVFLMAFLFATELMNNEQSMLITGIVFCGVALGFKYALRHAIFPNQLAFALSLAGQGLIIGSRFEMATLWPIVLTVLILEGVLFVLYPDSVHRLSSLMAIVVAIVAQLADWSMTVYVPAMVVLLATGSLGVWWQQHAIKLSRGWGFFAPLAIGLPLSVLGLCIVQLTAAEFVDGPWWQAAVGLGVLLLVLGGLILHELDLPSGSVVGVGILLLTAVLMVPAFETPGVLAAVLVLGLAFWRRHALLLGIGIAGLLLFISGYYYNLDLTLLTKSLILMGSGLALLALRFGLNMTRLVKS